MLERRSKRMILWVVGTLAFWSAPAASQTAPGELGNAIYEKDLPAIRGMIEAGVDVNGVIAGYGVTPLRQAINGNAGEIVRMLAEAGADVNEEDRRGRTLLMIAVGDGRSDAVTALLESEADVARVDRRGQTALEIAYERDRFDLLGPLADAGANLDRRGEGGKALLHRAVADDEVDVVRLLLRKGASPDLTDAVGMTALIDAASNNRVEMVRLLLEAGADPNVESAFGMTARQMAELRQASEAVALLDAAGAADAPLEVRSREESQAAMRRQMQEIRAEREAEREAARARAPRAIVPDGSGTYPPGFYSGACFANHEDAPPANTNPGDRGSFEAAATAFHAGRITEEDVLNSPVVGDILRSLGDPSGRVGMDLITAMALMGDDDVVSPPECRPVELGAGEFTMVTHRLSDAWTWKGPESGCRPGVYCGLTKEHDPGLPKAERDYAHFEVQPGAAAPGEEPCRQSAGIRIESPRQDDQVAFDESPGGRLEVTLVASVSPEGCAGEVVWEADDIEGSTRTFYGPSGEESNRGPQVRLVYDSLPRDNGAFGPKTITAKIGASSEAVRIQVFFPPTAKNHPVAPGEQADTPNWFYYWVQTSAGGGYSPRYVEKITPCINSQDEVQGRYEYDEDELYLANAVFQSGCPTRSGKPESTGIDCFAEIVRHEETHRREMQYWWPVEWNGIEFEPHSCRYLGVTPAAPGNFYTRVDSDLDWVPDHIEAALATTRGCDKDRKNSCTGRPLHLSRDLLDNEMNAYTEGWRWVPTSADAEDWSKCGKQWNDVSVCEGGRRW